MLRAFEGVARQLCEVLDCQKDKNVHLKTAEVVCSHGGNRNISDPTRKQQEEYRFLLEFLVQYSAVLACYSCVRPLAKMALPGLRTSITPHAIITSWRSSLSRQVPNKQHIGPLRAFFSSNSCLKQSSHKSNTFFGAKPSGSAKSRSPPRINSSCSTSSKTSPVSFFQQGIFANSSLFNSHKGWTTSGTARFFSVSTIIKAARPNWYAGRQMETVRAGPIKKLQWTIDRKIPKVGFTPLEKEMANGESDCVIRATIVMAFLRYYHSQYCRLSRLAICY